MKVILLQHIKSLGQKGEIKEVSPGYFQNFLLPRRLAVPATPSQVSHIQAQQAKAIEKLESLKESAEAVKAKCDGKSLSIALKASEAGKLYASVHPKEIVAAIRSSLNVDIPEKCIELPEAIKSLGSFAVKLKLYKDVSAQITLHVIAS